MLFRSDPARTMDQIRKCCFFDGKDPLAFLERIEELRTCYGFSEAQLLLGLPELLRGEPLLWHRNFRHTWNNWEHFQRDFRHQYLPRRHQARLRREAEQRYQLPGEPFAKFLTAILTLTRRAGSYDTHEVLDLVIENMLPKYRLYIRTDELESLPELSRRAADYEEILECERERSRKIEPTPASVATVTYNRDECCWRCKQRGHTRFECKRPPKKFCSRCGKDGIFTKDCHPAAGNARRTAEDTAAPRSAPE